MRNLLLIISLLLTISAHANPTEASYRIFGQISTVNNETYKGFITWGGNKNYWIDLFEAKKIENPYSHYFKRSDETTFRNNGQSFAMPPVHTFSCRFGDIATMRLTGHNEVSLSFKNGEIRKLSKGSYSDINTQLKITTEESTINIAWEQISEILFMPCNQTNPPNLNQAIGIVKSKQGIYKGLITWNSGQKDQAKIKEEINLLLKKADKIIRQGATLKVVIESKNSIVPSPQKENILYPLESITVNMPNFGFVTIPFLQFEELTILAPDELTLLTYSDFDPPHPISGEITLQSGENINGTIAYDLDESLNIEILEGRNNYITYRIPFKYIRSIEPKNYKYSYLTLYNGIGLSLGDMRDVDDENSGCIVFANNDRPTYIPWGEIKKLIININRP